MGGAGRAVQCARAVYMILNEMLLAILETMGTYITRKLHVKVTSVGFAHARPIMSLK